jgi:alpha-beta hydrolase superfamily lysophospholipase
MGASPVPAPEAEPGPRAAQALPAPRFLYLQTGGQPAFAAFHAGAEPHEQRAVLICPPFGWEDMCSYRSRRDWAEHLARAGYSALRLDLPGSGDSAGDPGDPGRLAAWTEAVANGASWLRQAGKAGEVVAIGIGLGGMLACRAALQGAPIEELVLWQVPARGRALVRELRAFAALEVAYIPDTDRDAPDFDRDPPDPDRDVPHPDRGAPDPDRDEEAAEPLRLEDGALVANGYLLSAATVAELRDLDLADAAVGARGPRRALLLGRDGLKADERLRAALEEAGTAVTVADGPGFGAMTVEPQEARPPTAVFGSVDSWLREREGVTAGDISVEAEAASSELHGAPITPAVTVASPAHNSAEQAAPAQAAPARDSPAQAAPAHDSPEQAAPAQASLAQASSQDELHLSQAGVELRERPITVQAPEGPLFGILTEPLGERTELGAVLVNAGAQRHIGPNRMWVEIARRWAARGVPTLRFDLGGIGDSDGDAAALAHVAGIYKPAYGPQMGAALEVFGAHGLPERFVVLGLCAGGYWSMRTALEDERVRLAILLNTRSLIWDEAVYGVRRARELRERALLGSTWRKALRGELDLARHIETARALALRAARTPRRLRARLGGGSTGAPRAHGLDRTAELAAMFERLQERGQHALLLFTGREPLHRELAARGLLERMASWPNIEIAIRGTSADTHTLTPLWLQRQVHELVDRALEQELARPPGLEASSGAQGLGTAAAKRIGATTGPRHPSAS